MKPRWLSAQGQQDTSQAVDFPTILLIEGKDELRDSRRLLLSCIDSAVEAADMQSLGSVVPATPSIRLVVIAISGGSETEHTAFLVRRRWPQAKILLIGQTCGTLREELYDDIIDPCCNPVGFVEVSRRLLSEACGGSAYRIGTMASQRQA